LSIDKTIGKKIWSVATDTNRLDEHLQPGDVEFDPLTEFVIMQNDEPIAWVSIPEKRVYIIEEGHGEVCEKFCTALATGPQDMLAERMRAFCDEHGFVCGEAQRMTDKPAEAPKPPDSNRAPTEKDAPTGGSEKSHLVGVAKDYFGEGIAFIVMACERK
jgi:hypothetical protein